MSLTKFLKSSLTQSMNENRSPERDKAQPHDYKSFGNHGTGRIRADFKSIPIFFYI